MRNPLTYGMTIALLALGDERIAMAADAAATEAAQSTAVQEWEISGVRPGPRLWRGSQGSAKWETSHFSDDTFLFVGARKLAPGKCISSEAAWDFRALE